MNDSLAAQGQGGVASPTRHQPIYHARLPRLGEVVVGLGLDAPLVVEVDRGALPARAGSGLRVALPGLGVSLEVTGARVALASLMVELEARDEALGAFEEAVVSGLLQTAAAARGWTPAPGEALLDRWLAPLERDARGWMLAWSDRWHGLAAQVWMAPSPSLRLEVSREHVALRVTPALRICAAGAKLELSALRYRFDRATVEIEQAPAASPLRAAARWLREGLLHGVAWGVGRWLRRKMPTRMAQAGYDPMADFRRVEHVKALISALRGADRADAPANASPGAPGLAGLLPAPSPIDPAALEALMALWRLPLGPLGAGALCAPASGLSVARDAVSLRVSAGEGLRLVSGTLPWLEGLRLRDVHLSLDDGALELVTDPPLGQASAAIIAALGQAALADLPGGVRALIGLDAAAVRRGQRVIARLDAGRAVGVVDARMPAEATLRVSLSEAWLAIEARDGGLSVRVTGLAFLPPVTIHDLRYRRADATLRAQTTPALGALGHALVTRLVQREALPRLPPAALATLSPPLPAPDPTLGAALRQRYEVEAVAVTIPVLGDLEVRLTASDTLRVRLGAKLWRVESEQGLGLIATTLGIELVARGLAYDFSARRLTLDASLEVGAYEQALLAKVLEVFAWPALSRHVNLPWAEQAGAGPWTIASFEAPQLERVSLRLEAGAELVLERSPQAVELASEKGLLIEPARDELVPAVRIKRLRWSLPDGGLRVSSFPPLGALSTTLAAAALRQLAPAALNAGLARAGLPGLLANAPATSPDGALQLARQELGALGALLVHLDPARSVRAALDPRRLQLTSPGGGLGLTLPALGVSVTIEEVSVDLDAWSVGLTTRPATGPLERGLIAAALRQYVPEAVARVLPPHPADATLPEGFTPLLTLGEGTAWGPARINAYGHAALVLEYDARSRALCLSDGARGERGEGAAGLWVESPSLAYVPNFYLHLLEYTLGKGAVAIDISGIEETHYVEDADVGVLSEAFIERVLKATLPTRVPPWLRALGVVGFDDEATPPPPPAGRVAFRAALPGGLGALRVEVATAFLLDLSLTDTELSLRTSPGLQLVMPTLRFSARVADLRYHLSSGEVQVDGLGQLENALLEALLERQLGPPQRVDGLEHPMTPIGARIESLPMNANGRRKLFKVDLRLLGLDLSRLARTLGLGELHMVGVYLPTDFALRLHVEGSGAILEVRATPPLIVDGLGPLDFKIDGLIYDFDRARFDLKFTSANLQNLLKSFSDDNIFKIFTAGASFLTGLPVRALLPAIDLAIDHAINKHLLPMLPEAMRTPGYRLGADPNLDVHISALIGDIGARRGSRASGKARPG